MTHPIRSRRSAQGFSLIELLVGMALMIVIVTAASMVYLNSRESDSSQARVSESIETGTFALQLMERDVTQAWSYPVVMPPATVYALNAAASAGTALLLQTYPPIGWNTELPPAPYQVGLFGCDGGKFNSTTGACDATTVLPGSPYRSPPDSLVINYFSSEAFTSTVGNRTDCNGADAGADPVNAVRQLNDTQQATGNVINPTTRNADWPPAFPVFVSNRYALTATSTEVDKQTVNTYSLSCNGNGANGSRVAAGTTNNYQPLLLGVEDLQITYGAFDLDANSTTGAMQPAPTRFYNATDAGSLPSITLDGVSYAGWSRIVAVRVCVMTRSLGNTRLNDKSGAARTYLDCTDDTPQPYGSSDRSIRTRSVQVFAVRNRMNQIY